MEIDFTTLDIEQLKKNYEKANVELKKKLLNGSSWEEVKEKSQAVTELAILIHKKRFPLNSSSPAESPFRKK